jgi:hypothetical protein
LFSLNSRKQGLDYNEIIAGSFVINNFSLAAA